MWKTIIVENVVGCDVDRAKAIIRMKSGKNNLNFEVRELPDNRSKSQIDQDEKHVVILWIKMERDHKYYVTRKAKFQIQEKDEFEYYTDSSDNE